MRRLINSKAFQRGLLDGFVSPFQVLAGAQHSYKVGQKDLVAESWQEVGNAMRLVVNAGRLSDVKVSRKDTRNTFSKAS